MAEILVTSATVRSRADELGSLNGQIKSRVSDLVSQEGNLNNMWEGEANTAFHKAFGDDVQQMEKFSQEIEKYIQALQRIAVEYEKAEKMNVELGTTRSYR